MDRKDDFEGPIEARTESNDQKELGDRADQKDVLVVSLLDRKGDIIDFLDSLVDRKGDFLDFLLDGADQTGDFVDFLSDRKGVLIDFLDVRLDQKGVCSDFLVDQVGDFVGPPPRRRWSTPTPSSGAASSWSGRATSWALPG